MASFSSLDGNNQNIPYAYDTAADNALGLTNPDAVLSGQNRGTQSIGGTTNIQSDPANQRLVVNDGSVNRISFGKLSTNPVAWGMKVSKDTFNVDTATVDQLIFNSDNQVLYVAEGPYPVSIPNDIVNDGDFKSLYGTVSFTKTYQVAPIVLAFVGISGGLRNGGLWPGGAFPSSDPTANPATGGTMTPRSFTVPGGVSPISITSMSLKTTTITTSSATFTVTTYNSSGATVPCDGGYSLTVYVLQQQGGFN